MHSHKQLIDSSLHDNPPLPVQNQAGGGMFRWFDQRLVSIPGATRLIWDSKKRAPHVCSLQKVVQLRRTVVRVRLVQRNEDRGQG